MKNRIISNVVPVLFAILTIYTVSIFWNKITIPFENPEEVVGFYAINNQLIKNTKCLFSLIILPGKYSLFHSIKECISHHAIISPFKSHILQIVFC